MALPEHIELRPLEPEDFAAFLELQQDAVLNAPEVFGSDYDWFDTLSKLSKEQRYQDYMHFPHVYLLGAFTSTTQLVGLIGFSNDKTLPKTRHKGKIWGMYVIPEERGQGIASTLVDTVLSAAEDLDIELVQLSVGTQNKDSYSLYLRKGFTVYGTELRAMKVADEYVDEYLMVKFIL